VADFAVKRIWLWTPANHLPLRGNGKGAWFGWPDDPKIEELRDSGRLRPLTPSPSPQRLAVMPFRHGSVCQIGDVISTLRVE
jgi:hypothetical protein